MSWETAHRVLTLVAIISCFGIAQEAWNSPVQVPATGALIALVFGAGLVLGSCVATARTESQLARLDYWVLALAIVTLAAQGLNSLYLNPAYGSDEAAFAQVAAHLLLHGHDPYGANLLSGLSQFRVPFQSATSTLSGGTVATFGYPSVPILTTAAAVLITGGFQAVPIANLVIIGLVAILMFKLLDRRLRPVAVIVCIGLPITLGFAIAGDNAVICMALLVLVAYKWTNVGISGVLTRVHRLQAVALGVAIATQQLAWFVTPFLLVGIYLLRCQSLGHKQALRLVLRYVAYAATAFLLLNLPFMIWSFHSWASAIGAPLTQNAIPYGQGFVDLTLFLGLGGGNLSAYNACAALLLFGLLAVYAINFRKLARACFLLPIIPLFYASRSLAEYFITIAPAVLVSVATFEDASLETAVSLPVSLPVSRRFAYRRLLSVGCLIPALVCLIVAIATPQPLQMQVTSYRTNGTGGTIAQLRLRVHNTSGGALAPHFAANWMGQATTFWTLIQGPRVLAAGAEATYVLTVPNTGSAPSLNSPFVVEAFTSSPETFSSSKRMVMLPYSTTMSPMAVSGALSSGTPVIFTVQIRSSSGGDAHKAGVQVILGQTTYLSAGPTPGSARINGGRVGRSVAAYTDASGRAKFRVVDSRSGDLPVNFQAWIQPVRRPAYAYSNAVSVTWR